jgi:HD-like signal output (HDOD) protein
MLKAAFADQRGSFMDAFWRSSARSAAVATMIANRTGLAAAEDAYAVGLFCDCGIPILRRKFSNYGDLYSTAQLEVDRTFTEFEEDIIGTNHAVVGFMMANGWMLPDIFAQSILQHHDPIEHFQAPEAKNDLTIRMQAVMHLALHVCRQVDTLPVSKEWAEFGTTVTAFLGMDSDGVDALIAEVGAMPADGFSAF